MDAQGTMRLMFDTMDASRLDPIVLQEQVPLGEQRGEPLEQGRPQEHPDPPADGARRGSAVGVLLRGPGSAIAYPGWATAS